MKTLALALGLTFFAAFACGEEISYPNEPLRNDPVEDEQSLYPGTVDAPSASGNTVSVDYIPGENVPDPDSVYAGLARSGACGKNRLTFKNGHVARFVLGGFSLKGDVTENTVVFSGGLVADAAIGKLCGGQTKDGDVNENAAMISGGKIVGDVYGGDADANGHAVGNRVEIHDGEMLGFVNGGGVSGIGIARKNRVTITGGKIGMGVAGGFAHFAGGAAPEPVENGEKTNSVLENAVVVSGKVEIDGNVSGGFVLDSNGSARKNTVEISGGTIRGNVYGGRTFRGEASENTVTISGGTIKDRDDVVFAGYVGQPDDNGGRGRATGNTITITGSPDLKTITLYGNNLPSWKTDGNTLNFKKFHGTVHGFSGFQNVNVDKDSQVTVTGRGPYEIVDLNNDGRMIFKNGALTVHGKAAGNRIERDE